MPDGHLLVITTGFRHRKPTPSDGESSRRKEGGSKTALRIRHQNGDGIVAVVDNGQVILGAAVEMSGNDGPWHAANVVGSRRSEGPIAISQAHSDKVEIVHKRE